MINFIRNSTKIKKIRAKKKVLSGFREKGACSIDLAIQLTEFDREDFPIINELRRKNIIVKVGYDDLYYLDEQKLLENRMGAIKWAMIILIASLILLFKQYM